MKEKMISKIILVLIMMVVLLAIPMNIFATSDGAADLNEFWEDQTTDAELETPEASDTTPEQTTPTTPEPTTPTTPENNTKTEETLPEAGLAEDTMMVVAVIALGTIAVFANKKVNEFKNI